MSRICTLCEKGANKIYSRSKSHISTIKQQQVNLQVKTIEGIRVKLCTRCIKTINKS